jgi:hypothetical protein
MLRGQEVAQRGSKGTQLACPCLRTFRSPNGKRHWRGMTYRTRRTGYHYGEVSTVWLMSRARAASATEREQQTEG